MSLQRFGQCDHYLVRGVPGVARAAQLFFRRGVIAATVVGNAQQIACLGVFVIFLQGVLELNDGGFVVALCL